MNRRIAVLVVGLGLCGLLGIPVEGAALGSAARLQGETLDRPITLKVDDVDLVKVYGLVSRLNGIAIECQSARKTRVTLSVSTTVREALSVLEVLYDVEYSQQGDRILVKDVAKPAR
jgi:hypothetical protein